MFTWRALPSLFLRSGDAVAYGWVRSGQPTADITDEQILERLLKLNLERAAAEAKPAQIKKPKTSRAKREDEMI